MFTIQHIANIVTAKFLQTSNNAFITKLANDSRRIHSPANTLFFAITTNNRDGHQYIKEAYAIGIRNFIVSKKITTTYKDANIILVKNTVTALQQIAAAHRATFNTEVIGVTGSNGKTMVKEWLYQLLHNEVTVVRSPKSYNSQIGVPLSVWAMDTTHQLGIFEAGISTVNEMSALQKVIQPTIGILTNIGAAHSEGFKNDQQKLQEKLLLFTKSKLLIYNSDNTLIATAVPAFAKKNNIDCLSWGYNKWNTIVVKYKKNTGQSTAITLQYKKHTYTLKLPFIDAASIENALHCIAYLLHKQYSEKQINVKLQQLQPVALRLEQKKGQHHCILINDSYSNDWDSLVIGLDYLNQQRTSYKKVLVLTDMQQSGMLPQQLYKNVAALCVAKNIEQFIGIGSDITKHQKLFQSINETVFFATVEEAKEYFKPKQFTKAAILFKGARSFAVETIVQQLEEKVHQTVLEIDLTKLIHNIKAHQQLLLPNTQVMAVVKAFGYGSGSIEVAQVLQQLGIQYLAVAYTDEGIALRKAGIHLPIMVMNVDAYAFDSLLEYNLEPELFSHSIVDAFLVFAQKNALSNYPVHIKLDTGMHRLGFMANEIPTLCNKLQLQNVIRVQTIFSHLVGSQAKNLDAFTKKQDKLFNIMATAIENAVGYTTIKHIANSTAIERHKALQYQMVRLGIGMYGVTNNSIGLQQVCTLKTTIAQLKTVAANDTVGYNRKGKLNRVTKIATIRIGYADGYDRKLSNGVGKVLVGTQLVPIVGNVCMDMTMIDVTDVPNVQEGDYVTLFSEALPVQQLAHWCGTIPYEILTGISERVKRVYIEN